MAKRTKKRFPIGCLFWTIFILLIVILFYLNKDTIFFVLEKTQAKKILFNDKTQSEQQAVQKVPEIQIKENEQPSMGDGSTETEQTGISASSDTPLRQKDGEKTSVPSSLQSLEQPSTPATDKPALSALKADSNTEQEKRKESAAPLSGEQEAEQTKSDKQVAQHTAPRQNDSRNRQTSDTKAQGKTHTEKELPKQIVTKPQQQPAMQKAVIYWIRIDADGKLIRRTADRMLPKSNTPMSDALEALFKTPVLEEAKKGLRTLIPPGTKLRSAWVKDGIAFINLSEEFQFNQYGIEGALAQLSQVVFTATEFSTVQSVQFLIEGQKKDYLGAEGVWIGTPLSRSSF